MCITEQHAYCVYDIMCVHQQGAAYTLSDTQYLYQMSWTSWCDAMLLEIHYGLLPHLIGGTDIIIINSFCHV